MPETPYAKIIKEELILRDHLAADRTTLANERTYLAYVRTSMTMFIVGVSLIKFFNSIIIQVIGGLFMLFSLGVFVLGSIRYRAISTLIQHVNKSVDTLPFNNSTLNTDSLHEDVLHGSGQTVLSKSQEVVESPVATPTELNKPQSN